MYQYGYAPAHQGPPGADWIPGHLMHGPAPPVHPSPGEPRTLDEYFALRYEGRRQACNRFAKTASNLYSPFRQFFIDLIIYRSISVIVLDCGFDLQSVGAITELPRSDGSYMQGSTNHVLAWLEVNKATWDRAKAHIRSAHAADMYVRGLPGPLSTKQIMLQAVCAIVLDGPTIDRMSDETTDEQRVLYTTAQRLVVTWTRNEFSDLMLAAGMRKSEKRRPARAPMGGTYNEA